MTLDYTSELGPRGKPVLARQNNVCLCCLRCAPPVGAESSTRGHVPANALDCLRIARRQSALQLFSLFLKCSGWRGWQWRIASRGLCLWCGAIGGGGVGLRICCETYELLSRCAWCPLSQAERKFVRREFLQLSRGGLGPFRGHGCALRAAIIIAPGSCGCKPVHDHEYST
jgi:hypothetical protein